MNIGDTEGPAGCFLLGSANAGNLASRHITVCPAGITIGAHAVADLNPRPGPLANSAPRAKIDVVGVGGDYQNALNFHQIPSISDQSCQ